MTAKLTPEQRRQNILDRIDTAGATLAHLWEEIDRRYVELCGESMLTCDGVDTALVEAVLKERPDWAPQSIASVVAAAYEEYDNVMRKAVRAKLDTYPYELVTCERGTQHNPATCVTCTQNDAIYKGVRLGLIGEPRVREWRVDRYMPEVPPRKR